MSCERTKPKMRVRCEGCGLVQTNRIHKSDEEDDTDLWDVCTCRRCQRPYAVYAGKR